MTAADDATSSETHRHLTYIARGGAIGLVGAAVSAVAGFVLVLVVTNGFSAHTAGVYFTATSTFLLLTAMATLGTETGLGRFLLRYEKLGRPGDVAPTIRAAFRPTMIYSVILGIALFALAEPVARLIGIDGDQGAASLRVMAILVPFATWNALTLAGTRAFGRMRATVLVDKIFRPVAQLVLALLVAAVTAGGGLLALTFAWSIPYAVAAVASAIMLRRLLHRRGTYTHKQPTKDYRALRRDFWVFTWPRSITRMSQMAIQRLDIILIAALRSPTEAAIYTAATRFVALGQFGTQAIQQVLQPRFTALIASGQDRSLREVYKVSAAWSMAVAWPMYVVIGCAPYAYLRLFGADYAADGVKVVVLMAVAMLFSVATGPADTLLLMSGRSSLSLANSLVALALDVGLCFALIPGMGITGAAIAWAVASMARAALGVMQVRFTMSIISFGRPAAIVAAANVICFGIPLLLLSLVVDIDLVVLVVAVVVCSLAYAGALWLGRGPLALTALRGLVRRGRAAPGVAASAPGGRRDDA